MNQMSIVLTQEKKVQSQSVIQYSGFKYITIYITLISRLKSFLMPFSLSLEIFFDNFLEFYIIFLYSLHTKRKMYIKRENYLIRKI